jgi:citrate lyase subunit beta/citryl-CoA lyase
VTITSGPAASTGPAIDLGTARSLLFVPGDRPDRFAKAAAAGADAVVVDLEDAVAPAQKSAAREAVDGLLASGSKVAVRVNAVGTPWHDADVELARRHGAPVVLPKADAAALAAVDLTHVLALVETARGLLDAAEVAEHHQVRRLALGHLDLTAELGVSPQARTVVDSARTTLLIASVAAGLAGPVDGVTAQVRDADALADDLHAALALGCTGKLCIHPVQVPAVHAALAPDPATLAWARRVVAAQADSDGAGVLLLDGQMVDAPVLLRAHHVIALAEPSRTPTQGESS